MGKNDPYHVEGQKHMQLMKEYFLSDICTDLAILMTSGLKPEFYIHKRILIFLIFDQVLNNQKMTQPVSLLPMIVVSEFCHWAWAINWRFKKHQK